MQQPMSTDEGIGPVREVLRGALARYLGRAGRAEALIDARTDLLQLGPIDSQALVDIILEVEESSGRIFDPERLSLEGGITLDTIAGAFANGI